MQALCVLPQAPRASACHSFCVEKALFPGCPPSSLTLFISSFQGSLSPKERDLLDISHLEISVPMSLALCILLANSHCTLHPSGVGESHLMMAKSGNDLCI